MDITYFLLASVLLTLAPGPDNIYLMTKSLSDGAKNGIVLAFGLVSGIIFHTTLVILGVATLIQQSPTAFVALKICGAAYLLYLAKKALTDKSKVSLKTEVLKTNLVRLYVRGVLMNALNPKVLLFFLAFLPQFVNFDSGSVSLQIARLGLLFALQALVIMSAIAIGAGQLRRLVMKGNVERPFNIAQGIVLIGIAVALLFP